jgi:hypothetical protein
LANPPVAVGYKFAVRAADIVVHDLFSPVKVESFLQLGDETDMSQDDALFAALALVGVHIFVGIVIISSSVTRSMVNDSSLLGS